MAVPAGAATQASPAHSVGPRRQPEHTVLHQILTAYWPQFRERADEHGGLPKFMVREVEDYLDCGRLEKGCVVVGCAACGFEHLVAFSCKRRSLCPSCSGRRMNDSAAFLVDRVLPLQQPIRQWVCSLPFQLRYLIGYHAALCGAVADAFACELIRSYRRRAKRVLGLRSLSGAHTGTVTFVQRFDSALRLSPHMHVLCIDGIYQRASDGSLGFHALPEPTLAEVAEVAARTATRVALVLPKHGRDLDEPSSTEHDALEDSQPVLASCYRAATAGQQLLGEQPGQPVLRLMVQPSNPGTRPPKRLVAEVRGFNVHAERVVDGRDRPQLERLVRYLARPALSNDRLTLRPDGRLRLELKTPWSDGTAALVLAPLDLISRLCALVAPPRFHLTRFHGVLAPAAKLRSEVVPPPLPQQPSAPLQLALFGSPDPAASHGHDDSRPQSNSRHPWVWLLKRVFQRDVTVCPRCQGRLTIREVARTTDAIARVLARHGLGPQPPPPPPKWVDPTQASLRFT